MKTLLALLGSLKFGKVLLSAGTMLLSVFTYALIYGWRYAAGFVALIFAHEMGHFMAARQRGLEVGLPTFIPFIGAWIQMKKLPHNVETEAYVALAGPVVGTISAIGCYFLARYWESALLMALAYAGFIINLFNLLPLSPLDGGRITAIVSRKIWWLGAPLLIGLFLYTQSPLLLLVAILAIPHLIAAWRNTSAGEHEGNYYLASVQDRLSYGLWYLGLAALLAILSYQVYAQLPQHRAV